MRLLIILLCLGFVVQSCSHEPNPITRIIEENAELQSIAADPYHEVQILYTQIDRDSLNQPTLTTYSYNVDDDRYFYPASTVKFPAVLIALEKMKDIGVPSDSRMEIDSAYSRQSKVRMDESAPNNEPSVAHYSKKILVVSDNDAFNRLYEFIGQDPFNEILSEKGYSKTRMSHRLSIFMSADENAHTNPMRFYNGDDLLYEQALQVGEGNYSSEEQIKKGEGYYSGGEVLEGPFDFTSKNYFPLSEQHQMIQAVIFPDAFPENSFDLTPEDRQLVLKYMSVLPGKSGIGIYEDSTAYWDSYAKFLLYGSKEDVTIPSNIKIFNKIGLAYGFTSDNAYIIDTENNIEFFLTAVVHTNPNKIYNDGVYDYETVAFPFMERLGRAVYEYELERKRSNIPDFSGIISN
ncbi:MAG: serine hydrolase [Cyanothece sp. SIO1E1]|nr:serine hydrolase [Cyanothece sp. SIO1E1]